MEKDSKYYSLIENLIKNHRKYQGCEAILDEIIADVYEHSKTVIASIQNEDVIQSYLQKVVTTSLITVPKRLNFHNELHHRNISVPLPAQPKMELPKQDEIIKSNEEQELSHHDLSDNEQNFDTNTISEKEVYELEQEPPIKANNEFVDKMINSIDVDSVLDIQGELNNADDETDEIKQTEDDNDDNILSLTDEDSYTEQEDSLEQDDDINDISTEEIEDIQLDDTDDFSIQELDDIVYTEQNEPENEETELQPEQTASEIDLTEDDMQIEEIGEIEEIEGIEGSDLLTPDIAEENNEEVEQFVSENQSDIELMSDNDDSDTEEEQISNIAEFEPLETDESVEDNLDIDNSEDEITDDFNDDIDSDYDLYEATIGLAEESDDSIKFDLNESEELLEHDELNEDDNIELINDDSDAESFLENENNEQQHIQYKPVNYSVFNYLPQNTNFENDYDELAKKIINLNNEKPELKILEIFELKYKKCHSIEKIAEELDIEKQDVTKTLNEIIDLI